MESSFNQGVPSQEESSKKHSEEIIEEENEIFQEQ